MKDESKAPSLPKDRSNNLGSHHNSSEESKNTNIINQPEDQQTLVRPNSETQAEKRLKVEERKSQRQSRYNRTAVSRWKCRDSSDYKLFD